MPKKPAPLRIAPLQRVVAEPVTDPAEPTVLDGRQEPPRRGGAVRTRGATRSSGSTASRVLDLSRWLPADERLPLLTRLAARLPPRSQLALLERLAALLPTDALRQAEHELRTRLGEQAP